MWQVAGGGPPRVPPLPLQPDPAAQLAQSRAGQFAGVVLATRENAGKLEAVQFDFNHPLAGQPVRFDVHVIGVSSLAAGHLTLVPALRDALAEVGRPDIMIVVGGVIPPGDFDELYAAGATAIFPPGTVIAEAASDLLRTLAERLGYDLT